MFVIFLSVVMEHLTKDNLKEDAFILLTAQHSILSECGKAWERKEKREPR